MARATKERLERDAARFGRVQGLVGQEAVAKDVNWLRCKVCEEMIGDHNDAQLFACAKRQKGITP